MCTLAECAVSAGGRVMQMAGEVWAAVKALRILKCASVLSDFVDIKVGVADILTADNRLEAAKAVWDICYAIFDIILMIKGIKLKGCISFLNDFYTYSSDISNIVSEFKKGNIIKGIINILILLKDILLAYAERGNMNGNQEALLDLISEEGKKGIIDSQIKNILYGWAKEYKCVLDYFGKIFYLW